MMMLEQVRDALRDRNLAEVSRVTGIPYFRLSRLRAGDRKNPGYELVREVVEYLEKTAVPAKD